MDSPPSPSPTPPDNAAADDAGVELRILIVDDEPPARARLNSLVEELAAGEVVGEAGNGAEALRLVERTHPDILLLDIRMPGMDDIEVARHLGAITQPPAVIFTTAYDSHALAAFEANAVDYLLKPIRRDRLRAALARARTPTRAQITGLRDTPGEESRARTHISATLQGNLQLVPVDDIRYFRAEHKYVTARFPGGELIIEDSLSTLEAEFGERFVRVHRNALVAIAHVRAMERDAAGRDRVWLHDIEDSVEVSRRLAPRIRRGLRAGSLSNTSHNSL